MSKKLGLKIKQLRSEYGFKTGNKITQKDLADKLSISRSYLGDIESGRTPASDEIIHKLAKIFEIDESELLNLKYSDADDNISEGNNFMDDDLVIIERARKKMSEKDKEK
ncbi:helix-turn-helix transcriptional regulator [Clostridium neonatale]|nr:Putative transcriptional regulator, Cro/C1 HTH domain [Clostridium neonatale]